MFHKQLTITTPFTAPVSSFIHCDDIIIYLYPAPH